MNLFKLTLLFCFFFEMRFFQMLALTSDESQSYFKVGHIFTFACFIFTNAHMWQQANDMIAISDRQSSALDK